MEHSEWRYPSRATPKFNQGNAESMPAYVLGMAFLSACMLVLWAVLRWVCEWFVGPAGEESMSNVCAGRKPGEVHFASWRHFVTPRRVVFAQPLLQDSGAAGARLENSSTCLPEVSPGSSTKGRGRQATRKHVSMENYLSFLRTCRDMFLVLSVLSVFMTAPLWGFEPLLAGVLGGQASLTERLSKGMDAEAGDLAMPMVKALYCMTILYGIVFLTFTVRFQQECQERGGDIADTAVKRKMRRTVWLQRLPLSDGIWGAKEFEYTDEDLERVTKDLLVEIRKFIEDRRQSPASAMAPQVSGQRRLVRSNSWHIGERKTADRLWGGAGTVAARRGSFQPVESIEVATHIEELASVSITRRDCAELADMYAGLKRHEEERGCRCLAWWYARRQKHFKRRTEELRTKQLRIELDKKRLSGSAFVTFTNVRDCRLMLRKVPPWWDCNQWFFRNTFSFGRPPFAAVTLFCYRAPHPDDVNWQNLHTKTTKRRLRYWLLTLAVAIATVGLSAGVDAWKSHMVEATGHDQRPEVKLELMLPPVCLLLLNNLVLPYSILWIALAEHNRQKSYEELRQLYINFYFLILTSIAVPFLGFDTLWQLMHMLWLYVEHRSISVFADQLGAELLNTSGDFTLRYILSVVFLSNAFVLLKVPLYTLFQLLRVHLVALSPRERLESRKPIAFAWGFWYAWVLITAATGIIYGVVLPSIHPLMALFFASRHWVDGYNLRRGRVTTGTDSEGTYAAAAVYHMVLVGVAWWTLMGIFFATVCRQRNDCPDWLHYGSDMLMLTPVVVLPISWLFKRHAFLGLTSSQRRAVGSDAEDSAGEDERVDEQATPNELYKLNWKATQVIERDPIIDEVLKLLRLRAEAHPADRDVVLRRLLRGDSTAEDLRNELQLDKPLDESPVSPRRLAPIPL